MEFEDLVKRLVRSHVEFVLIGGYAAVAHGAAVLTQDLDICLNFTKENLDRLVKALDGLNPRHRMTPQRIAFEVPETDWQHLKNLYLELDIGVLDCLGEVLGIGGYGAALACSESIRTPFGECRILKLEALIWSKEATGRPKDLSTARDLRAIQTNQANKLLD